MSPGPLCPLWIDTHVHDIQADTNPNAWS